MAKRKKKTGPKPKPPNDVRTDRLDIPISPTERIALSRMASRSDVPLTTWARDVLLRGAAK